MQLLELWKSSGPGGSDGHFSSNPSCWAARWYITVSVISMLGSGLILISGFCFYKGVL